MEQLATVFTAWIWNMDDQYDKEIYSYRLLLECEHSKRVVECKSKVEALRSLLVDEVQKIVGVEVNLIFDGH